MSLRSDHGESKISNRKLTRARPTLDLFTIDKKSPAKINNRRLQHCANARIKNRRKSSRARQLRKFLRSFIWSFVYFAVCDRANSLFLFFRGWNSLVFVKVWKNTNIGLKIDDDETEVIVVTMNDQLQFPLLMFPVVHIFIQLKL